MKERIVRIKGVKNRAVTFDLRWQRAPRLKILWVLRQHYVTSFRWKCKFVRLAIGVARGPFGSSQPRIGPIPTQNTFQFPQKNLGADYATEHIVFVEIGAFGQVRHLQVTPSVKIVFAHWSSVFANEFSLNFEL